MYEILAEYYDKFMADAPYAECTDYIVRILGDRRRGRDVGCGTGKFTVALKRAGYDVSGSDVSPEMLTQAAAYAKSTGTDVKFLLQSADKLADAHPLDFVTACCDVVNYLKNPSKFFERAYSALGDGGVLVFDVSSEYKLLSVIGNNVFTESTDDVTYVWENSLDEKRRAVDMRLTFFIKQPNNYYTKRIDEQTQYIHKEEELVKKLYDAGFCEIKVCGFLKNRRPGDNEQRIVFAAYK